MIAADIVAIVLLLAIAAYACGGGTDYGAGLWDLTAGSQDRGLRPRALIDYAMGPVWEVNNVWLVFAMVISWTAFPPMFADVFSAAWIPLTIAILGLILRGAGFVFRKPTRQLAQRRRYSAVFGVASILTPFFFAATLGGIASGRIPIEKRGSDLVTSWMNPTSAVFGGLAVAATAFIAAVFLAGDGRRYGAPDLVAYFRRRSVIAGFVFIVLGGVLLIVMRYDATFVFNDLVNGWALIFTIGAPVMALVTAGLLYRGGGRGARLTAIAAVGAAIVAWGLAQRPYLLPTTLTIRQGAGDPDTLRWLVIVVLIAVVLVGPALALLYRLDVKGELEADHEEDLSETPRSRPG